MNTASPKCKGNADTPEQHRTVKELEAAWKAKARPMQVRKPWNDWDTEVFERDFPNEHVAWLKKLEMATGDRRVTDAIEDLVEVGINEAPTDANPHVQWLRDLHAASGDPVYEAAIRAIEDAGLNVKGYEKHFRTMDRGPGGNVKWVVECRRIRQRIEDGKSERRACQEVAAECGFPSASGNFETSWRELRDIYKAGPTPYWGTQW